MRSASASQSRDTHLGDPHLNVARNDLGALELAGELKRRKEVYEALHPDTRKGVAGGKARQGTATDNLSFAEDTAKKTGLSERTVQRAVQIAEKIAPHNRKEFNNRAFGSGKELIHGNAFLMF